MKNLFKLIWNFFFPEKKKETYKSLEEFQEAVDKESYKRLGLDKDYVESHASEISEKLFGNKKTTGVIELQKNSSNIYRIEKNESISELDTIGRFKNDFRKLALSKGYEARYSGKEKYFYLHKINL